MQQLFLRALGPIEAELDGIPLELGGPRQRAVLALLLSVRGTVVPADRMIDQLWRGRPPRRAAASLQAYVSNLRRLLEPGRPPRAPATVLVSAAGGYVLRLPDDAVDARRFEHVLRQARTAPPDRARRLLDEALGWWRGPAYAEFADEEWAAPESARLTELRIIAAELSVEATVRAGRSAEAVPPAEVLTHRHPLREEGWRLLALALWASGRQADALTALRRNRRLLRDELGLDPGPALVELERAVLAQSTEVLHAVAPPPPTVLLPPAAEPRSAEPFVGREPELRTLAEAAVTARRASRVVIALVTGEAGAGKTRLLGRAAGQLAAEGWTVAVGRCPESDGAPPAWAWVEALRALAALVPPADPDAVAPLLREPGPPAAVGDASAGRFLLHRAVGAWIRAAARVAPLAIVVDDLHRADDETLALLEHLAGPGPSGAPLLLLTAYRPAEDSGRLAGTLAAIAARSPYRLPLAGLSAPDVERLVTAVCRGPVDPGTVAALAERTGGNPFYVRESARLLAAEGAPAATSEVPQGVRDVLRRRLARLPQHCVDVLRLAAVVGRESGVDVLIHASDSPEDLVLDGLEAGVTAGLLTEPAPGLVRFEHTLVRDTLYTDLTRPRRCRMHALVAEALRTVRPDDLTGLAHHCSQAATAALAPFAVEYGVRAAELAERRYAHDLAVELLGRAVDAFERIPAADGDRDARLVDLLGRLMRAQIRAGEVAAARRTRERALDLAGRAGRDDLLAAAFAGWSEPTPWQTRPYGSVDRATIDVLDRLLALPGLDPVTRCRLLDSLIEELNGENDAPRLARASRRQLSIARRCDDPALLAQALTSAAKSRSHELHIAARERIAAELRPIAHAAGLPRYRWICEYLDGTVAGARNDPGAVRRHAEAGLAIARRYRLVEPEVVHLASLAMLAHAHGDFDGAEARYAGVSDLMFRHRTMHAWDFRSLAVLNIRLSQGRWDDAEPLARSRYERMGPVVGDALALVLAHQGRLDEARSIPLVPLAPGHLHSRHATTRAELAVLLRQPEAAPELIRQLSPLRDQLPGAAYSVMLMRPVAHSLGELHRLLGDEAEAVRQFTHAAAVAERWGSPHWTAAARAAAKAGPGGPGGQATG